MEETTIEESVLMSSNINEMVDQTMNTISGKHVIYIRDPMRLPYQYG